MTITRTDSSNIDFQNLVKLLDADLAIRNGDDHAFYDQFNKIDMIKNCTVIYIDEVPQLVAPSKNLRKILLKLKECIRIRISENEV